MSYVEASDTSLRKTGQIKLHGPSGFAGMRKAGALVAKCLDELTDIVRAGIPTSRIDEFVREFAFSHGAYPATLMYRGYRYSTCTSLNHVVCHGIPADKPLREGDIVNVDVTLILDGWHGDSSRMYAVGEIPRRVLTRAEVTGWISMKAGRPRLDFTKFNPDYRFPGRQIVVPLSAADFDLLEKCTGEASRRASCDAEVVTA